MVSENVKRDWIEVGVHATLSKVFDVVTAILVVNIIVCLAILFFATPAALTTFFPGITTGLMIFTVVLVCTVRADKISRKAVRANG